MKLRMTWILKREFEIELKNNWEQETEAVIVLQAKAEILTELTD